MGDEVPLPVNVPPELKRLVDADERFNKDVVQSALWREFGGKRDSAIGRKIEFYEEKLALVEKEIAELEDERESILADLEPLRQAKEDREAHLESVLDDAAELIDASMMEPDNTAVKNWADKADLPPERFLSRLRDHMEAGDGE